MADELVTAKGRYISFHEGPGVPVVVAHRAVAHKSHPIVQANPDQWEPLTVDFEVEAAKKAGSTKGGGGSA